MTRQHQPRLAAALLAAIWPLAAALTLALVAQFVVNPWLGDAGAFYSKLLLDIGVAIVLAVSLTIVNGFTGQFSLGHAAFMAVGAYTAAGIVYYGSAKLFGGEMFADPNLNGGRISTMLLGRELPDGGTPPLVGPADLLFLLALLAGGLVSALCGYIVGLPSLRLKGDYLAIVTLGFGEIVRVLIQSQTTDALYDVDEIKAKSVPELTRYLGGPVGFTGLPFYTSLFWVVLFCGLTLILAYRLKASTFGRAFLSIREDEIAAEAMGVNTTRFKVRAFVIAAFLAGVAGGLYAHTVGVQLNAGELGFMKSFDIIIMVVLGGLGSISGAAIAAGILTILPELLREPPSVWPWGVGVGVVVAVAAAPFVRRRWMPALVIAIALVAWQFVRGAALRAGIHLSDYRMVLYALALIIIMILRPQGLLGLGEIWELRPYRRIRKEAAAP
jgi:branched-chain amino acid transport system permease protein